MSIGIELPIGTKFFVVDKSAKQKLMLEVVKDTYITHQCKNCELWGRACIYRSISPENRTDPFFMCCDPSSREDGEIVIFKKISKKE